MTNTGIFGEKVIFYIHLFIILIFLNIIESKRCRESLATLSFVSKCPTDYESWKIASERKHCDSVAHNQRCCEPKDFVYHCLINSWENATVEVCAPKWFLNGYCAEFNIPEGRIYNNIHRDCTSPPTHCPSLYSSSETYKYAECYQLGTTVLKTQKQNSEISEGPKIVCTDCSLVIICALLFLCIVCLACIVHGKTEKSHNKDLHERDYQKTNRADETESRLPLMCTHLSSISEGSDKPMLCEDYFASNKTDETSFRSEIYSNLDGSEFENKRFDALFWKKEESIGTNKEYPTVKPVKPVNVSNPMRRIKRKTKRSAREWKLKFEECFTN